MRRCFLVVIVAFVICGSFSLAYAQQESQINSGLVLYFKFDNQASYKENASFVYDLSGNKNNGRVYGALWNKTGGIKGGAFEFDGKNDRISVKDADSLSPSTTKQFSVAFWVKFKKTKFVGEGNIPDYLYILGKGSADEGYEYVFRQYNSSNSEGRGNRVSFYLFNLKGGYGSGGYVQEQINNDWAFYVGVLNGSRIELWKNGVLKDTTPLSEYHVTPGNGKSPFNIGTLEGNSYFKGAIDELRIYNRALSKAEITSLYKFDFNALNTNSTAPKNLANQTIAKNTTILSNRVNQTVKNSTALKNASAVKNSTVVKNSSAVRNSTVVKNSTVVNITNNALPVVNVQPSSAERSDGGGGFVVNSDSGENNLRLDNFEKNSEQNKIVERIPVIAGADIEREVQQGIAATGKVVEYVGGTGQSLLLKPSKKIFGFFLIFMVLGTGTLSYLSFREKIRLYFVLRRYDYHYEFDSKAKVLNNLVHLHGYD